MRFRQPFNPQEINQLELNYCEHLIKGEALSFLISSLPDFPLSTDLCPVVKNPKKNKTYINSNFIGSWLSVYRVPSATFDKGMTRTTGEGDNSKATLFPPTHNNFKQCHLNNTHNNKLYNIHQKKKKNICEGHLRLSVIVKTIQFIRLRHPQYQYTKMRIVLKSHV